MNPKKSGRPISFPIFPVLFGVLLLMSGIHTGFIVLFEVMKWPKLIQTIVPICYWALIAAGLTAYVRSSIRRNYEIPFRRISEAVNQVAKGDFSVRLPDFDGTEVSEQLGQFSKDFNRMAQELAGVETLRTDFVSNVSHELKTPLSVIQNYATMLQSPSLSGSERIAYAKAVTSASRRLSGLITNILKLNKLENQQIYPAQRIYNLGEQLCACLLDFEAAWSEKDLQIETDIQEDVLVESDPELLSLVWNNLFSNAVKFTAPGGRISLRLRTEAEAVEVSVADTGCGISPETGAHIFEKFYQGDTSHAAQGNGLGLALVKRIMDIVSGEIRVDSTVGVGSVFTVRLRKKQEG